ncbi:MULTISPECIES: DUF6479 family protein [Streptomyces]|uniref:DUF6479 family protein n=1 Tax=Streptomyces kaempferi TaxID=333725 RepID=A0ABW3XRY0_9ACTN|nr:DUF6479 family protein [Streptomyces sp. RPA4-2]
MSPHFLAASVSSSLFLIIAGLVLVTLLIGAFWYGSRRNARESSSRVRAAGQSSPAATRRGSWQTPDGETDEPPQH